MIGQVAVCGDDLTGDGREQLGDGLDRLDRPEHLALRQLAAHVRQFHEHDIAELALREVRDAHRGLAIGHPHPLVVLRVLEIRWIHGFP